MKAYRLKVTLSGVRPPVWRRLVVPGGINFTQLHEMLNYAMGWEDCHLFDFKFRSLRLRVVVDDTEYFNLAEGLFYSGGSPFHTSSAAQNSVKASEMSIDGPLASCQSFTYTYDFGDRWEHKVLVEDILDDYPHNYAMVLKWKGACPPEDCGGAFGYENFLKAFNDDKHPAHLDCREWGDSQLYDGLYDMDEVNTAFQSGSFINRAAPPPLEMWLSLWTKNDLKEIAKDHGLSGYSRYNKAELAQFVAESILNPEVMEEYFLSSREDELNTFSRYAESPADATEEDIEKLSWFADGGYCMIFDDKFLIPDEAAEAFFSMMSNNYMTRWKRNNLLMHYLESASFFYGVIPQDELVNIFNRQNKRKTDVTELIDAYFALVRRNPPCFHIDTVMSYLCPQSLKWIEPLSFEAPADSPPDISLVMENIDKKIDNLMSLQNGKPYYVPKKESLLTMNCMLKSDRNSNAHEFLAYFERRLKLEEPEATILTISIIENFHFAASVSDAMEIIVDYCQSSGASAPGDISADEWLKAMLTKLRENTRMVIHRGHTPLEIENIRDGAGAGKAAPKAPENVVPLNNYRSKPKFRR
jgi:hypothetical protein